MSVTIEVLPPICLCKDPDEAVNQLEATGNPMKIIKVWDWSDGCDCDHENHECDHFKDCNLDGCRCDCHCECEGHEYVLTKNPGPEIDFTNLYQDYMRFTFRCIECGATVTLTRGCY